MRTRNLIAVLAAGALALAGCGSTASGTPVVGSTVTPPSTSAPAASSAPASSAPAAASSAAQSSTAAGAGSAAQSAQSSEDSDSETSTDSEDSTDSSESQVTVGGAVDAQTTAWFSTFCTGFAGAFGSMMAAPPTGTGADEQSTMVKLYSDIGDAFTKTANALKVLPPPTFSGGAQFATDFVTSLAQAGPALTQAAQAIAAVDPTNADALSAAIEAAGNSINTAMAGVEKYALDDNTEKALGSIPACAPLMADSGGDTATTTTG